MRSRRALQRLLVRFHDDDRRLASRIIRNSAYHLNSILISELKTRRFFLHIFRCVAFTFTPSTSSITVRPRNHLLLSSLKAIWAKSTKTTARKIDFNSEVPRKKIGEIFRSQVNEKGFSMLMTSSGWITVWESSSSTILLVNDKVVEWEKPSSELIAKYFYFQSA